MSKKKSCILFINLIDSTFSREDIRILKKDFDVELLQFKRKRQEQRKNIPLLWFSQLFQLFKKAPKADIIYGWFADFHMLVPVLFGKVFKKPVVISMGGFDCMNIPELNHGVYQSRWRAGIAKYIVRNATLLLPVTSQIVRSKNRYTLWPDLKEFGLKHEIPDLKTVIYPLPTGYDTNVWAFYDGEREKSVCTVAHLDTERKIRVKGIDLFIQTANLMPEVQFYIVGVTDNMKKQLRVNFKAGSNLNFLPPVQPESLKKIYSESSVYAQLSRVEGLPNVVCEAMLCGCTPVGSRIFGIPEAIGEYGYLIDEPIPEKIVEVISKALDSTIEERWSARQHIIDKYRLQNREETLLKLIHALL